MWSPLSPLPPPPPLPHSSRTGRTARTGRASSVLAMVAAFALLSSSKPVQADIQCTQFGADTFRVGSNLRFVWADTQSVPIETFVLNLYCYENNKLIQTLATLNTSTSVSPQSWLVDQSIMTTASECPLNQYQGSFDWAYTDPNTGAPIYGSSRCKNMLLIGPGIVPPPGTPSDVADPPLAEDPTPSDIIISDKTKHVVIGVGSAVGVLVLAGIVGFYFIRYKNRRAEQELVNSKLREPLQSEGSLNGYGYDHPSTGGGGGKGGNGDSNGQYSDLTSVNTTTAGYVPVRTSTSTTTATPGVGEMVELNGLPAVKGAALASRNSYASASGSSLQPPSGPARGSFVSGRPPSVLTSPFIPPEDDDQDQLQRQNQKRLEEEQLQYEQQLQHQHQQQQLHMQQQQQQQQQMNYGNYPYQ